jgi:magnesium transporter
MSAVKKFPASTLTLEKILAAFLDALTANDTRFLEERGNEIAELEGDVLKDNTDNDFSLDLLALKKDMLVMHNYYEQLIDITEALEENENSIFDSEDLMYISNIANKIVRLREDVDSLSSTINHLQDAYSSSLDLKLNHTMKVFTVLTSIFFPLTIITGWYGMNFHFMPELAWKYGYIYVIALSVIVVAVLMLIGKKKKWY